MTPDPAARYLRGYPADAVAGALRLLAAGTLGARLQERYPERHAVRTDPALYDYVSGLKNRYLRNAPALAKVAYDSRMRVVEQALGMHTAVSRVQGGRLKAKREIRVAALFRDAPAAFLRMIVVHELAHLKERAHDRAFHALCQHMEPAYFQLEFDVRLWLTALESGPPPSPRNSP